MNINFQEENNLTELELLRNEYTEEITKRQRDLLSVIAHCCQQLGDYGEKARKIEFDDSVKKLLRFDNLNSKLDRLGSIWSRHYTALRSQAYQEKIEVPLEEGYGCIEGLEDVVNDLLRDIHTKLKNIIMSIKSYPKGRGKAADFQRTVCDLFEWLFIDELRRRKDLKRTSDGSQIKDGVFGIEERYNPEKDFGYQFQFLFLECKNYTPEPKSKDLLQLFGYTILLTVDTNTIKNIPLCFLISRKNPNTDDLIWKLRWRIYREFKRLIIFLDDEDLSEMVENKCNNDNPGEVIKDKVKEIQDYSITHP